MNLINEGISKESIYLTGNTVMDSLSEMHQRINHSEVREIMQNRFNFLDSDKKTILVTGHRRENFGEGFKSICQGINKISQINDVQVVYPVHLNPNVQDPVNSLIEVKDNIHLIEPLDYLPFIYLMSRSSLILTDSGGIQEEASAFNIPLLVMRENTERSESVNIKTVKLVGTNSEKIYEESYKYIKLGLHAKFDLTDNPYGDGLASEKIVDIILGHFNAKALQE
jgi:UDP-N-acetylglucosamine 2-epimerase (non-hydrolysing)